MSHSKKMHYSKTDPVDALHSAVLRHPGGIAAVAKRIGRSVQILYNKFSDSMDNEITAREALALSDVVDSTAYAEAVAAYFGGVFFKLPDGAAGDDDLLQSYVNIIEEMGDLSREFTLARADGVITPDEFKRLKKEGFEAMAAIRVYLAELETLVRELPVTTAKKARK